MRNRTSDLRIPRSGALPLIHRDFGPLGQTQNLFFLKDFHKAGPSSHIATPDLNTKNAIVCAIH